jgi:hypothetical protein
MRIAEAVPERLPSFLRYHQGSYSLQGLPEGDLGGERNADDSSLPATKSWER